MEVINVKNVGVETFRMFVEHIYGRELFVDIKAVMS